MQGQDVAMAERDSVRDESAAGPEAQAAMHAFEQQGARGGRPPRSLEDMMEAIMEQGYQDGMQACPVLLSGQLSALWKEPCVVLGRRRRRAQLLAAASALMQPHDCCVGAHLRLLPRRCPGVGACSHGLSHLAARPVARPGLFCCPDEPAHGCVSRLQAKVRQGCCLQYLSRTVTEQPSSMHALAGGAVGVPCSWISTAASQALTTACMQAYHDSQDSDSQEDDINDREMLRVGESGEESMSGDDGPAGESEEDDEDDEEDDEDDDDEAGDEDMDDEVRCCAACCRAPVQEAWLGGATLVAVRHVPSGQGC